MELADLIADFCGSSEVERAAAEILRERRSWWAELLDGVIF